jgi:pSer/pThr/pTyr-binding forkhead associated (FHA) protein
MAYLVFQLAGGNHVDFELPPRPITIGRSPQADLQIADEKTSRIHCGIRPEGDSFILRDLGSTNGTWVNDQRIREVILRFGDRLRLGGTLVSIESEPLQRGTSKLPEEIEVVLPDQPFAEAMQQLAEEATRVRRHPPTSPSAR